MQFLGIKRCSTYFALCTLLWQLSVLVKFSTKFLFQGGDLFSYLKGVIQYLSLFFPPLNSQKYFCLWKCITIQNKWQKFKNIYIIIILIASKGVHKIEFMDNHCIKHLILLKVKWWFTIICFDLFEFIFS